MRRGAPDSGGGRRAVARSLPRAGRRGAPALARLALLALLSSTASAQDDAPERLDVGRFTAVYYPQDQALARALLRQATGTDSFPWLPRPRQRVLLAIAPDGARFRAWAGPAAPEWGAALAFPESRRIILQGRRAGSDAGNPLEVFRHELAHLALHEVMGDRPPRWFDEGYASVAAREWGREDVLAANVALALRGTPSLDELDAQFEGGAVAAQSAYALSYRAVSELAALDPQRGLTLLFAYWRDGRTLDAAIRQAFGITLAGFEREFQRRTRQRYGGLALFADISLATVVLLVLVVPFVLARRARDRRRMAALREADARAEQAAQEENAALDALLGPAPARDAPSGGGEA